MQHHAHSEGTLPPPLLRFLRNPTRTTQPLGRLNLWQGVGWLSLLILIALLGGLVDGVLEHVLNIHLLNSFQSYLFLHPTWRIALLVAAAPLLEELAFRAMLSTSPRFIFIGLTFFIAFVYEIFHQQLHTPPAVVVATYFDHFWVLLPAGVTCFLLYRYARSTVLGFFEKHGVAIFWMSCILFGAAHDRLYANHLVWWSFLLVLPQFLLGVLLASIRVRFGLRWSIAGHYTIDSLFLYGTWLYVSLAPYPNLQRGMMFAVYALGIFVVLYGLVMLVRIVRHRC